MNGLFKLVLVSPTSSDVILGWWMFGMRRIRNGHRVPVYPSILREIWASLKFDNCRDLILIQTIVMCGEIFKYENLVAGFFEYRKFWEEVCSVKLEMISKKAKIKNVKDDSHFRFSGDHSDDSIMVQCGLNRKFRFLHRRRSKTISCSLANICSTV